MGDLALVAINQGRIGDALRRPDRQAMLAQFQDRAGNDLAAHRVAIAEQNRVALAQLRGMFASEGVFPLAALGLARLACQTQAAQRATLNSALRWRARPQRSALLLGGARLQPQQLLPARVPRGVIRRLALIPLVSWWWLPVEQ